MNIRLFIAEVKKRKALWDQSNRHYHNKKALNDGWKDIARTFNLEVIIAKQKWKNLRDTFRVELKKTKRYSAPEPSDGSSRSLWAYYEDMYFLKDILKTRKLRELEPSGSDTGEILAENVKIERDDTDITFSPNPLLDDNDTKDGSSNLVIGNVTTFHTQNEDVDTTNEMTTRRSIKRRKSSDDDGPDGNDDDHDDDLLFFRSLLPFVKKLDQDKKLLFRMNVQQMLYNQLYN